MNLVVNSRDAMPDGGRILIETENVLLDEDTITEHHLDATPGPCVMLAVSDTGIGMDRETCSRVFEPFFTTKEESGGTGLGLSTVYGIVKQSGGSIWLYSEPELGTTFKIYLPAVMEEQKKATVERPVPGVPGGTESVLVVEDDDSLRRLACKVLSRNGYTVLEAALVEAAVQLTDTMSDPVDLLITDVVMPGMNGVELADRIAERFPDIRVLFISGYTDHAVLEHGILDSGRPFLQKPFALNDLLGKVRETLDGC
jgi:CheY-like chemotaxis protein